jgi:hypothetical protein
MIIPLRLTPRARTPPRAASLLPRDAINALQQVIQLDPDIPPGESFARREALNEVIDKITRKYPQLFRS